MPVEPIPCAAPEPEPPIPPCCSPGLASTGLCLADGTPIAVLSVTACGDCGTEAAAPEISGWLNLLTGQFTAGPPPAGAEACAGTPQQFEVGQWCDLDPEGEPIAPVLVEYEYDDGGQLIGVRTLTPGGDPYTVTGTLGICPGPVDDVEYLVLCDVQADGTVTEFLRALTPNGDDTSTARDTTLDGSAPYTAVGTVGVCQPPEPCPSTVDVLQLCDLNPTVAPDPETGLRCAVPFLRHLVHDCAGALADTRDTELDGITPYSPVQITDCGSGVPALAELLWPQTGITEDPAGVVRQDFIYTVTNPQTDEVAEIRLHASSLAGGACGAYNPAAPVFNNPTTYTLSLSAEAQEMSTFRLDLIDFDTFEGITSLNPVPSRVEGDVTWTGSTIRANQNNVTAHVFFDRPPATISYRYGNTGGGTACSAVAFQGMTLIPDGCCGCDAAEPCRDTSSTLLCDTSAADIITVFDPANRPNADGWEVVSFTGARPDAGPEAPMPYPARYGTPYGYPALGARADQYGGYGGGSWAGYDAAPVRWVLRKQFTAPEDGVAIAQSVGFRGDGGARVRINGIDAGMYGQWNQPATSGTAEIPVTAGPNVVEIEVRDVNGINNVVGRLDVALPKTVQFMRRQTVDCETGAVVSTTDTTLDGEPYEVTGEVGQCTPATECCEQPPPEARVDVETQLLCLRDTASGEVLGQVLLERVYDDQTGDLVEQRVTDPTTGAPVEIPAGAELGRCPTPDRITRQICVAASGSAEFLTNAANATSGQDTDWSWSPSLTGPWHPMYRVAPNPVWTATDTAPNQARWVAPHSNRTVCPPAGQTAPPVPGTWYTRASWMLPVDVDPATIRISASILNADNRVVQWRLNEGPWQPVTGGTLANPPWAFPPTAVPGGRAGQNDVIVQVLESQPAVSCPSPNEAGMILHVAATYDHEPRAWTQVMEDGRVYYLDETGARQDALLPGDRIVPCGGGGEGACCPPEPRMDVESDVLCIRTAAGEITDQVLVERVYDDQTGARTVQRLTDPTTGEQVMLPDGADLVLCQEPACPVAFSTECVGVVTRTEASYDNTSLIGGQPGQCGSVQGPGGQFPCQPTGPLTITSWVVDGEETISEGGGRAFNGGPCGPGTATTPGMHLSWAQALTNLDPTGATWSVKSEPACAFFVGSVGGTRTVYGSMTVQDAAGQQWILGPAQACEEVQYTKVYTQECDGSVSVSWLDADGAEATAPPGDRVPCGTGCGSGGGRGLDVEVLELCDVQADGTLVQFLRHLTYGSAGQVTIVVDTALDAFAPYTPSGTVRRCPQDGRDVELLPMCVIDNASGSVIQRVLAEAVYDAGSGDRTGVRYVDPRTWGPVALPGGTHLDVCPQDPAPDAEVLHLCDRDGDTDPVGFLRHLVYTGDATAPTVLDTTLDGTTPYTVAGTVGACDSPCRPHVVEACRWDDTDGDGIGDVRYVELVSVDGCTGALTPVGTYLPDMTGPYEPTAPVDDGPVTGAPAARGVQAHRVLLAAGASWDAATVPLLQSVTVVAHGTGQVTTVDGPSALAAGESIGWSVARDSDAALTGPLTVSAVDGPVAVAWTRSVAL
ncbi:hypothetical protein [Streptomyces anulatus]|uniref:hypothetical protein n=1 Tax=Streptomyces anulatus TaxID=1892 RepID=UPI0036B81F1D